MNKYKYFLSFCVLSAILPMAHAKTQNLECPDPNRITVTEEVSGGGIYFWLAPKLPSTQLHGMGLGGQTVGAFKKVIPSEGSTSWICVYQTPTHPSLANATDIKFTSHANSILKNLPNTFQYGFILYLASQSTST